MLFLIAIIMYIDLSQCFSPAIPSELCPLILFVILVAILLCPFPILYYSSRRWLVLSLGRIVLSLFFPVEFRDFFIADELNSLAYSFWTSSYFFCSYGWHWDQLATHCTVWKYSYTPLIASLPPWWRLLQCVRRYIDSKELVHVYNGMKYTTSILVTLITGYRRIYSNAITVVIEKKFYQLNECIKRNESNGYCMDMFMYIEFDLCFLLGCQKRLGVIRAAFQKFSFKRKPCIL